MVIPLPDALSNFSQAAKKAVEQLEAINQSVPNIQGQIQENVVTAATNSVTGAGSLFEDTPDFVSENIGGFFEDFSSPAALSTTTLDGAFANITGVANPAASSVQEFVDANVRLQDVIPAQQLFSTIQNFSGTSLFSDPLQAFTSTAFAAGNLDNQSLVAIDFSDGLNLDINGLLSIQSSITYSEVGARDQSFFQNSNTKFSDVSTKFNTLQSTFNTRGRFDETQRLDLCSSIDDFNSFVTFGNTKILEFERKRADVVRRFDQLRTLGRNIPGLSDSIQNLIPKYIESSDFGRLFNSVQSRVLKTGRKCLDGLGKSVTAAAGRSSLDSRTSVLSSFGFAGELQGIRSFVCGLDPSTDVTAAPEFANLNTAYTSFVSDLSANNTTPDFQSIDDTIDDLQASMRTGVVRDNTADLTAKVGAMAAVLGGLSTKLTAICGAAEAFRDTFKTETSTDPNRLVGGADFTEITGLDSMRDRIITDRFDEVSILSLSESTTEGELTKALDERIADTPDGNERDRLLVTRSDVFARHRAKVVSMDFQQRTSIEAFLLPDQEEEFRQNVNEITKTFAPDDDYDPVTTDTGGLV